MARPLTVTALARRFGLSRTALLHYDRVGLLSPSSRTASGARLYAEGDVTRLEAILGYRRVGVPLERIKALLETGRVTDVLTARLAQLDAELAALEEQRRIVRAMLGGDPGGRAGRLDKRGWVAILRASGLDDAAMLRWHREFERQAPDAHRVFLSSLGLPAREVARIRRKSVSSSPRPAAHPPARSRGSARASASGAAPAARRSASRPSR